MCHLSAMAAASLVIFHCTPHSSMQFFFFLARNELKGEDFLARAPMPQMRRWLAISCLRLANDVVHFCDMVSVISHT